MENLIKDTIKKIKERHIKPSPKWKYLVKKYGLWALFAAIVILAAISFSAAYDNANQLDWDLYPFMHQNRLIYFLSIFPYFWTVLIAIFLAAAFFEARKTETGYRFSWMRISLMMLAGFLIAGSAMSLLGFGGRLNSAVSKNLPYGKHMMTTKETQWMQPKKGFLAGTITSVSDNGLAIEDLNNEDWKISLDRKTSVRPSVSIKQGEEIKIIGKQQNGGNFQADEIRPWAGRGAENGGAGRGMMNGNGNR